MATQTCRSKEMLFQYFIHGYPTKFAQFKCVSRTSLSLVVEKKSIDSNLQDRRLRKEIISSYQLTSSNINFTEISLI